MAARKNQRYGWIPDLPDHRDHLYAAPRATLEQLPESINLRSTCPPVYDQLALGSCTAQAIAGAMQFDQIKQKLHVFIPSRLFIYYNEREMMGTVDTDSGAMLRDGIKSVNKQGGCPEVLWPYDIAKFRVPPPTQCYQIALKHKAISYRRVLQNLLQMRGCLAEGNPFVFGFSVYESFESDKVKRTGQVPMPGPNEAVLGGHACLMIGYDAEKQVFLFRNSWGDTWGDAGYGSLPEAYMLNSDLSSDFWTIEAVE